MIGKGDKDQVLNELIAEQAAEDDDPPGTPPKTEALQAGVVCLRAYFGKQKPLIVPEEYAVFLSVFRQTSTIRKGG